MAKRDVGLKLQALDSLLPSLPKPRLEYWQRRIAALQARARNAVGATVIRPYAAAQSGDTSQDQTVDDGTEWDLDLANGLDAVYTAVSDEASRVRKESVNAIADATSSIGFSIWPLALAALALAYAYSTTIRRR